MINHTNVRFVQFKISSEISNEPVHYHMDTGENNLYLRKLKLNKRAVNPALNI